MVPVAPIITGLLLLLSLLLLTAEIFTIRLPYINPIMRKLQISRDVPADFYEIKTPSLRKGQEKHPIFHGAKIHKIRLLSASLNNSSYRNICFK
jgi:hypothetical protein